MAKVLIIDDEAAILDLMAKLCIRLGHEVSSSQTGREGLAMIGEARPDLLIVDLRIGDISGLEIIEHCHENFPDLAIIMVTGYASVETAVEAMKHGAFDYITKPFQLDDLQRTINGALASKTKLPADSPTEIGFGNPVPIIGESPKMKEILALVEKVADNDSPVLLEGEFGSGKQMVARALHDASRRSAAPFKIIQCSALPEKLLEQEFFGNGANSPTIFMRAQGGTVLIEEIDLLPIRLQSQLDSMLQELGEQRLRGNLPSSLDFRLIASSTESLGELFQDGKFREDLYYRLSVIPIHIPPLRRREVDVEQLAEHFLDNHAKRTGQKKPKIDKYSLKMLTNYGWPGNVGELQNAMERACAFSEDGRIRPTDLPPKVTQKVEITDEENEKLKHHLPIGSSLSDYITKQEQMFIRETLKFNEGSREKTASMLGVSIATLYRKMGLKTDREKILA